MERPGTRARLAPSMAQYTKPGGLDWTGRVPWMRHHDHDLDEAVVLRPASLPANALHFRAVPGPVPAASRPVRHAAVKSHVAEYYASRGEQVTDRVVVHDPDLGGWDRDALEARPPSWAGWHGGEGTAGAPGG